MMQAPFCMARIIFKILTKDVNMNKMVKIEEK